jgi:hypothetical protein
LVIAAHLYSASWWQAICYTATTLLLALLFCSIGLLLAMGAAIVRRTDRWFEHIGFLLGIIGGVAFIAVGLLGAWVFFRSAVLGL